MRKIKFKNKNVSSNKQKCFCSKRNSPQKHFITHFWYKLIKCVPWSAILRYKAVVQAVLLYGSETWVLSTTALASATPVKFPSGYQRCIGCKYWFKQIILLYCKSCWKMKKDWLPDPPPPKSKLSRSKIKTARQKRTKQGGNRSDDTLSRSSSNETEDPISAPRITLCMLCCTNPRNASLIHGQIGHQLCCYPCAKKLWKEQARCPVCRRKIEKVVKLIQNWFLKIFLQTFQSSTTTTTNDNNNNNNKNA